MTSAPAPCPSSASSLRVRAIYFALILALCLPRLLLVWNGFVAPQRPLLTDSTGYLELANSLRLEGRFHASEHEESLRTPGYPAFVALVQAIFGERVLFVVLAQVLLTLLTAWLLYRAAHLLGGERAGLAAAWLYALSPNALFWAGTIMTETFFAFWLALALAMLIDAVRRTSWRRGGVSGLALGLAVLTRPIGLYLIPLWAAGALVARWKSGAGSRRWLPAAAVLLAALMPVLAWQTRNLLVHESFRLTASFRTVFIDYTAASTLGDALGISRDEAATQLRQSSDAFAAALDAVRRYPGSLVQVSLQGIARTALGTEAGTWLGILSGQSYQPSGLLDALLRGDLKAAGEAIGTRLQASSDRLGTVLLPWGLLYSATVYLLSLRGFLRLRWVDPSPLRWVAVTVILSTAYLIVMPLTIGDARFRVPVEPFLAILGGMAWIRPAPATHSLTGRQG